MNDRAGGMANGDSAGVDQIGVETGGAVHETAGADANEAERLLGPDVVLSVRRILGRVRLRVATIVPAAGATRGTIVIAHGYGQSLDFFLEPMRELAGLGFATLAFDWRCHGGSDRLTRRPEVAHVASFSDYGNDLKTVLRHADEAGLPRPFHVLAHSMGGAAVLLAAPAIAGDVERMVLVAPMLGIAGLPYPAPVTRMLTGLLCTFGLGQKAANAPPRHESNRPRPAGAERPGFMADNTMTHDRALWERMAAFPARFPQLAAYVPTYGWISAALRATATLGSERVAAELEIPTLFLTATDDRIVENAATERFARRAELAEVLPIPGARHHIPLEAAPIRAQALAAVDAFLNADSPRLPVGGDARRRRRPPVPVEPVPEGLPTAALMLGALDAELLGNT